jgi:hypothetical protein
MTLADLGLAHDQIAVALLDDGLDIRDLVSPRHDEEVGCRVQPHEQLRVEPDRLHARRVPALAEKRDGSDTVAPCDLVVDGLGEPLRLGGPGPSRAAGEECLVTLQRLDDRRGSLLGGHNLVREILQLRLGAPRRVPKELERTVHVDAESLAEHSLRLLDHDPRVQRMLELLCAGTPERLTIGCVRSVQCRPDLSLGMTCAENERSGSRNAVDSVERS